MNARSHHLLQPDLAGDDARANRDRRTHCTLARTVRFACPLEPAADVSLREKAPPRDNAFSGWPSFDRLALHGVFIVEVDGTPDPTTGYLISVADIDTAVRASVLETLTASVASRTSAAVPKLLRDGAAAVGHALGRPVRSLALALGPYLRIEFDTRHMNHVILRQSFEFSAAHRLHCPQLDAEANRAQFGKCNNPNGHGHNYRLEIAVRGPIEATGESSPGLTAIEALVRREVIDLLDHRHLNEDVPQFRELNPSVEHIALVCRDLLEGPVKAAGGELVWLTVWETEKTCCTVEGSAAGGARP